MTPTPPTLLGGAAAAAHPDAALIQMCRDFAEYELGEHFACRAETDEETADAMDLPPDFAALRAITNTPALTEDGWRPKALAYCGWRRFGLPDPIKDEDVDGHELLVSIVCHMAGSDLDVMSTRLATQYGPAALSPW